MRRRPLQGLRRRLRMPRWRRFVMHWATTTLRPPGPRAAALSTDEAIAYAQRGRGERKRPTSGWASLTPTETRRRATGQRRTGQQGHRHTAFHLTAHRADPPHPRLHQTRPHLARATRSRSCPPRLTDTYSCRFATQTVWPAGSTQAVAARCRVDAVNNFLVIRRSFHVVSRTRPFAEKGQFARRRSCQSATRSGRPEFRLSQPP